MTESGRILFCEDTPFGFDLEGILFTPLTVGSGHQHQAGATQLNGKPERRAIAVTNAETVKRLNLTKKEGLAVYAPITKRYE